MKKMLKLFLFIAVFIFVLVLAVNIYINNIKKNNPDNEITLADLQELSKSVNDDRVNILLLGVDSLDGSQNHANMRTDTMMLLSVDPKTKTAFILSIPRDTRAEIEEYKYKFNKINSAHSIGGINATLKAVKKLLNVDIHHFVKLDYQALFKTINDIGGVEVDVPMDMNYDDPYAVPPLHIELKKGLQLLDGEKSMQFLRFRYGYANQDLGRIESQQKFMTSLIKKVLSVESAVHIPQYIDTFYKYVQTDMSITDMLKIASKCIDIKPYNIKKEVLPGEAKTMYGTSYYIANPEKSKELLDTLLSGNYYISQEMQNENLTVSNGGNSTDTSNVTNTQKIPYVVVLNGNGRQGSAQRAKDLLFVNNIEVQDSANADNFDYEETVVYYTDDEILAQNIATILGANKITQENKAYYGKPTDIVVVLGKDFVK